MNIGKQIKAGRKCLKMSIADLAEKAGCSPSTISGIETGVRNPSQEMAERILRALREAEPKDGTEQKTPPRMTPGPVKVYRLSAEELAKYGPCVPHGERRKIRVGMPMRDKRRAWDILEE